MSVLSNRTHYLPFLLLLLSLATGCKKDADIPLEIRPSDFWVQATVANEQEETLPFAYRGEEIYTLDTFAGIPYPREITYTSTYGIDANKVKFINGTITDGSWGQSLFSLTMRLPELVTDPFLPFEWTKSELESVLIPGATFIMGDAPGQVSMAMTFIQEYERYQTQSGDAASVVVTSVEDYGSPEANIAYFGKKVHIQFEGDFYYGTQHRRLTNGEAVLFFRYFNY